MERADNSSIYIVGGGPSLKGFDFNRLDGKRTVAVNAALQDVPNPEFFLTADTWYCGVAVNANFWGKISYRIMVIRRDHKRYYRAEKYLLYYNQIIEPTSFDGNISLDHSGFATGQNSGFCALQYAVRWLNPSKIHLLGFDFSIEGGEHYHDRYKVGAKRLDEFAEHFITGINIVREKTDIEIISCSPISPLNDYIIYKELKTI